MSLSRPIRFHAPAACLATWLVVSASAMVEAPEPDCNAGVAVERTAWLMGTSLRVEACAPVRSDALAAIETVFRVVGDTEKRLSTWLPDSDLSRLNAGRPFAWVDVSPATASVLRDVRAWTAETEGAFDPAVGAALDAWDLRGDGRVPADAELVVAAATGGPAAWEVDDALPRARRLMATRLDAGGFGKGAGLRAALDSLAELPVSMVLDFGGQLALRSDDPAGARSIAVAHPRDRDRAVVRLRLTNLSAATTGASERHVDTSAGRIGHVLDPRTGRPVPPWGSVTVVTADPLVADILSTALFVMGPDEALRWSRERSDVGVLVLETDPTDGLAIRMNSALRELTIFRLPKDRQ